ncbi:unnamed protein product [Symbiodinium sp. CCMP2592]|nr:unnamed protein product [Symbiodinium sp. CCMP2592]
MLKRASALAKKSRQNLAVGNGRTPGGLNLRESPLMRWAAARVGTGAPASYFREVARAAADEIDANKGQLSASHVALHDSFSCPCLEFIPEYSLNPGSRWASRSCKNKNHAENLVHNAMRRSDGVHGSALCTIHAGMCDSRLGSCISCCDLTEVPVKCTITHVDLPISLLRPQKRPREDVGNDTADAENANRGRGRGRGRGRCRRLGRGRAKKKKKGHVLRTMVYKKWPVFLPHHMAHALMKGGADQKAKAHAIAVHGDEGQGKKQRSVLVLSWSCLGIRGKNVLHYKLPFADAWLNSHVIRSAHFVYDNNGKNLTLESLQRAFANSLRKCSDPAATSLPNGTTLQYCCGRGDWKWKAEWLQELHDYTNLRTNPTTGRTFCRRCRCTSDVQCRHWLDAKNLSWYEPALVQQHLDASMPSTLPLRSIPGYHADMEQADTLHNLWLGPAKDTLGSVLMDIVEFHPEFRDLPWEEGLQALCSRMHDWFSENNLDRSCIDELSHSDLLCFFGIYRETHCS